MTTRIIPIRNFRHCYTAASYRRLSEFADIDFSVKYLENVVSPKHELVVDAYEHAILAKYPQNRYPVGNDMKFFYIPMSWLPFPYQVSWITGYTMYICIMIRIYAYLWSLVISWCEKYWYCVSITHRLQDTSPSTSNPTWNREPELQKYEIDASFNQ